MFFYRKNNTKNVASSSERKCSVLQKKKKSPPDLVILVPVCRCIDWSYTFQENSTRLRRFAPHMCKLALADNRVSQKRRDSGTHFLNEIIPGNWSLGKIMWMHFHSHAAGDWPLTTCLFKDHVCPSCWLAVAANEVRGRVRERGDVMQTKDSVTLVM